VIAARGGVVTLDDLPDWVVALLREGRVGHLGLLDRDGWPRVLPVTYALLEGNVWTAIDQKPKRRPGEELARVRWLRADPRSALVVDRYDDDWTKLMWIQFVGNTSVHAVEDHKDVLAALRDRYPQYCSEPPGGPLLCLTPAHAVWWSARHREGS
jgi:PPOX class probable F420-dependent enzyme